MEDINTLTTQVYKMIENRKEKKNNNNIKIQVGIGKSMVAKELSYRLDDYYTDPKTNLEFQLKWKLFHMNNFSDDLNIRPVIGIDFGPALEASFFGIETPIRENEEPAIGSPIINKEDDLAKIRIPDFYESGEMPRMHYLYEEISNLIEKYNLKLDITFPGWARGPWSIAWMLRGVTPLMMDFYERPRFVHQLMDFITNSRIEWEKERLKFLDLNSDDKDYFWSYCYLDYRNPNNTDLYNDEVDGNLFSADMYREFILPYEKKLNEFYSGTYYYHSCGNLAPFLSEINDELHPDMIHISPWTDEEEARKKIDEDIIIQRSLHPQKEVLKADEEKINKVINKTVKTFEDYQLMICADAFYSGEISDIRKWLDIAKDVVNKG